MRAAVLERFGEPLAVKGVDPPRPGAGEVAVRVRAAGICRTDLKIVDGAIPTVVPPLIPGHEPAGEVAALGPGVEEIEVGDRVAIGLDVSCGTCPYCRVGELDHCARLKRLGFERPGALAELIVVPAGNLVPVADEVSFEVAATLPDAVGSSYHAVLTRGRVKPAQAVAIYGLGGLGLVAVQVAALAGAEVIAIARTPERRRLAEELGARYSLDPSEGELPRRIKALTGGLGVDAFLDFVGIEGSTETAARACRKGGRVVVVGYNVPELRTTMMGLVYDEIAILGSRGSTRADLHAAAALVARGEIKPVVGERIGLDEVNRGLEMLRAGSVVGRIVVHPE